MRMLATALVASLAMGGVSVPASACGDKLLVIGRRVQRVPKARHPATLLLYLRAGSALRESARQMKLEATLRQAGHSVVTEREPAGLRGQLATGRFDFVLADLADAAPVARTAGSGPGAPGVVAVAHGASEEALRAARDTYPVVIEAGRSRNYLITLDNAMGRREGH
jgi:hypothetical protein